MRVVVLDDSEPIAESVAMMAGARGWDASAVTHETVFQALVRDAPPEAIFLDLQLGDSDGIEQLHFLRSVDYGGAVVLMSGFDARVLESARRIGEMLGHRIFGVIGKPASAQAVGAVLTEIERHSTAAPTSVKEQAVAPLVTSADVAAALDRGRMELHLQPIVRARDCVVVAAEALIRWWDPELGQVKPERFIHAAEQDAALIDRLTMWVVETAIECHQQLVGCGLGMRVSVNVSGLSLRERDFPDRLGAVLQRMSVPYGAIGLEITESAAIDDLDASADVLTRLRLKGFHVALDDFGAGNWSLTSLRRFPFSAVKIDKSLVAEVETSLSFVRSVVELARDLGLESVAEGVANAGTARLLAELSVDYLQGYHLSQPLPVAELAAWLQEGSAIASYAKPAVRVAGPSTPAS
jgi:EAL domain-containing protein (putative c-di-GMP-specific phosphodiesterase class I)/ActR/RegA family two-component response regulator